MYDLNRDMLTEVIAGYIELAKQMKGELVILNKIDDEADEFLITNLKDFNLIKISEGDLIELTIYVDDEDEIYEEFVVGEGLDYPKFQKNISEKFPKYFKKIPTEIKSDSINSRKQKPLLTNKDSQTNHFQKFMKKNK
ncbi:hypothetical protein [uncultured Cetobacterium sp.]|uniref:hypothetical protein n=1 Tax=uncultured Cetobacterium sp. TaxID=527638 RepID=UPI0026176C92|nr:hypothetical protein [uncultured Cetobacterium sp.]